MMMDSASGMGPIRLASVHTQHPDFRELFGKLIALGLVHKLADSGDVDLQEMVMWPDQRMLVCCHVLNKLVAETTR